MLIDYFLTQYDICLQKANTYISTHISRCIDGFHIQLVFNQVKSGSMEYI